MERLTPLYHTSRGCEQMTTLGDKLQELRKGSGLHIKVLAKQLDIGQGTYSDLANDKYLPVRRNMEMLKRIALKFGYKTPAEFFADVDEWEPVEKLQLDTDEPTVPLSQVQRMIDQAIAKAMSANR